jgi:fructose-specific phosphotransferase system IIA component
VRLLEYLSPESIFLDISGKDKSDVISKIVHRMKQRKVIDDEKDFIKEVFQREALGCTAIGSGVAIPHARTRAVNRIIIAFARLSSGVDFGADDHEPVRLLFVLGTPPDAVGEYLKVLAKLSKLLKEEDTRARLMKAKSTKDVTNILEDSQAQSR